MVEIRSLTFYAIYWLEINLSFVFVLLWMGVMFVVSIFIMNVVLVTTLASWGFASNDHLFLNKSGILPRLVMKINQLYHC